MFLVPWVIVGAIMIVPIWRIFKRAGLNPALSLFIFVPLIGWVVVYCLLAFMRWPATDQDQGISAP